MGRRGVRGGVRRLDDRRSPKPHKYRLTRSNRTRMQRSNAHWQSDPIKEIFLYIAASASILLAFLPLFLFFPDFSIQYSFLPFFPFFSPACGHPLKISMQYSLELDVGFIINVKYSCYLKNVGHIPPVLLLLMCACEVFSLHGVNLSAQAVQICSIPQSRFVKAHPYVWFESH